MMIQLTKNKAVPAKSLIPYGILLGCILVAGLIWFFLWRPALAETRQRQADLEHEQRMTEMAQTVLARRPALEEELEEKQDRWNEAQVTVPGPDDGVRAMLHMDSRLQNSGVAESRLFYEPLHREEDMKWMPFVWEAHGSYEAAAAALLDAEERFPSLQLQWVSFGPLEEDGVRIHASGRMLILGVKDEGNAWSTPRDGAYPQPATDGRFGAEFSVLESFYTEAVELKGMVVADTERRMLVNVNGEERWVRPGDSLGPGRVDSIARDGVFVDIGGMRVELAIGGQRE